MKYISMNNIHNISEIANRRYHKYNPKMGLYLWSLYINRNSIISQYNKSLGIYINCSIMIFDVYLVENFQKMELERKKVRIQKTTSSIPMIRYHSVTMPLIETVEPEPNIV